MANLIELMEALVRSPVPKRPRLFRRKAYLADIDFRSKLLAVVAAVARVHAEQESRLSGCLERVEALRSLLEAQVQNDQEKVAIVAGLSESVIEIYRDLNQRMDLQGAELQEQIGRSARTESALAQLAAASEHHTATVAELGRKIQTQGERLDTDRALVHHALAKAKETISRDVSAQLKMAAKRRADAISEQAEKLQELARELASHAELIHRKLPAELERTFRKLEVQVAAAEERHAAAFAEKTAELQNWRMRLDEVLAERFGLIEDKTRQATFEIRAEIAGVIDRCSSAVNLGLRRPESTPDVNDPDLERSYVEFEKRFRGSPELVFERFRQYVPLLNEWCNEFVAGNTGQPLLDLQAASAMAGRVRATRRVLSRSDLASIDFGSGRGEWLRLLIELGWENLLGVDSSSAMVDDCCRSRGLPVMVGDATTYLLEIPEKSLAMITGFHIVEHLAFRHLRQFFRQVGRVLHPGGLCIFETPNPENILTATQYFYLDPTHQHPLPPDLLAFLVEDAGLKVVQIFRMQPNQDLGFVVDALPKVHSDPTIQLLLNHFRASRDYAVIARAV